MQNCFHFFSNPHRVVRYEDLSLSPYDLTQEVLQFYGLAFDERVTEFLDSHTKTNGEYSSNEDNKDNLSRFSIFLSPSFLYMCCAVICDVSSGWRVVNIS